ncbi:DUF4168 domain-containing protein [Baaleninema sp.]|uniref:DUF4168 domain-containing protein n=1 Tax=Baaleninema sp. TaxID=3101197 RepID=UPI003CFCADEE
MSYFQNSFKNRGFHRDVRASIRRTLLAIAFSVWMFCWNFGAIALAEESATETQSDKGVPEVTVPATVDSNTISSEKVSQFATAYLNILDLLDRRGNELQEAETTAELQQVERELEAEIIEFIDDAGLTPPEYLQLLTLANSDSDFSERVVAQLQEIASQATVDDR